MNVFMYVCKEVNMYVCMHGMYACMCMYVSKYLSIYVSMYACMHVCMCKCVYIYHQFYLHSLDLHMCKYLSTISMYLLVCVHVLYLKYIFIYLYTYI